MGKFIFLIIVCVLCANLSGCTTTIDGFTKGTGQTVVENVAKDTGSLWDNIIELDKKFRKNFW